MRNFMRKSVLASWMLGLLFWLSFSTVFAAPPPSAVKTAKDAAPLHLIGVVKADVAVRDESGRTHFTSETRKMTLEVQKVVVNQAEEALGPGDAVDVYYFYYPPSEQVTGPGRVSVMVGDQIEIWLKKGADGWMPALAGDTVSFLQKVEPRREPGELSFLDKWRKSGAGMILGVCAIMVGILWMQRQRSRHVK